MPRAALSASARTGRCKKIAVSQWIFGKSIGRMLFDIANFLAASAARQRAAATRKQALAQSYLLRLTNAAKAAFVRGAAWRKAPPTPPPFALCDGGFAPITPLKIETQRTDKLQFFISAE